MAIFIMIMCRIVVLLDSLITEFHTYVVLNPTFL